MDDRYLHRSAKKAVQALQTRAISEPKIVSHVIQGLVLGPSGQYNFDNATKTKTIGNLIKAAEPKSLLDLLPALCRAMEQPQENDEKRADAKRRAFADILVSITTHVLAGIDQETDPSISLVKKILDALLAPAYSNKSPGPDGITFEPQVSLECRTYLRSRIRTCLELILQHSSIRSNLFRHTIETLRDIQKQAGSGNLMVEFDEQIQQIVDEAWSNMKRISKAVRCNLPLKMPRLTVSLGVS